MATYASYTDVQSRLGRPLTTDEQSQVTTLLGDVEILLKSRIPDLADKITNNDLSEEVVVMVESNVVVRFMRNPDGFISETDGDYTYQKSGSLASGQLEILDNEWALLGVNNSIFMINPKVKTPFEEIVAPSADSPLYSAWCANSPMFWCPL